MEIYTNSSRVSIAPTRAERQAPEEKLHGQTVPESNEERKNIDFRYMSRDDLKVWINEEIKAGNMTLEESRPFMLMTLNLDASTLEPIEGAKLVNFMDMAKNVAEFHRSIGKHDSAEGLDRALDIMKNEQRGALSVIV